MNHREAFIKTKRYFGITGSRLHEVTGISTSHISEFLNYRRDVTTSVFDRLISGMEELEPGALQFYTEEIRGKKFRFSNNSLNALIDSMDNEQISELMLTIAAKN